MAKEGTIRFFFKGDNTNVKKKAKETEEALADAEKKGRKHLSGLQGAFKALGGAAIGAIGGGFLKSIVNSGIAMEQTRVSFETMLGSATEATKVINDLREFANVTPFVTKEVIDAGKSLISFGVAGDQVKDTLRTIGDVAAGVNVPIGELSNIYGKIINKGKIQAEEINQLSERGIPILKTLSKELGVSTEEVLKLGSQGKLSADVFKDAMSVMTSEGGQFQDMMKKQSETLGGLISTIQGKFMDALANLGEVLAKMIAPVVKFLISGWDALGKTGQQLALTFMAVVAVVGVLAGGFIALKVAMVSAGVAFNASFLYIPAILGAVAAGAVAVWKNWDYLVAKIKNGIDHIILKYREITHAIANFFGKTSDADEKAFRESQQRIEDDIKKRNEALNKEKKNEDEKVDKKKKSTDAIKKLNQEILNDTKKKSDLELAGFTKSQQEQVNAYRKAQDEKRKIYNANADLFRSSQLGRAMGTADSIAGGASGIAGGIGDIMSMTDQSADEKDALEMERLQEKNSAELEELQARANSEIAIEKAKLDKIRKDKSLSDAEREKQEKLSLARLDALQKKKAHDEKVLQEKQAKEELDLKRRTAMANHSREVAMFNARKVGAIADGWISISSAILKTFATTGIFGKFLAGTMAAIGAAKIGVIAAQAPPPAPAFQTGGVIEGIGTGTSDSINARVSNGEAIINASRTEKLFNFIDDLTTGKSGAGTVQVNFEAGAVQGINTGEDFVEMVSDEMARRLEQLV